MAIDYGDKRTGLAFSDLTCSICGDAFTVNEWNAERLADTIAAEVKSRDVGEIVLGLPRNMDGSEGERAEKCRAFGVLVEEKTGIRPIMWDERRSSVEAHAILHANGKKEKQHKKTVDAIAASLMLEGYLNSKTR